MTPSARARLQNLVLLVGVVLLFLALLLPTLGREGIGWDEQTDLNVATRYATSRAGLLWGSPIDVINVRLPMYSVAMLYRLTGDISLPLARLTSCAVSVLTLLAVYLFCARELDHAKGLLACLILATSPYFLSFSRMAFTEGDVFVTCAVSWALLSLSLLRERPSLDRVALAGVSLGIALSSKISAIGLMPAALLVVMLRRDGRPVWPPGLRPAGGALVAIVLLFGAWLVLAAAEARIAFVGLDEALPYWVRHPVTRWVSAAGLWLATLAWAYRQRRIEAPLGVLAILLLVIPTLTFFVFPPVHTGNSEIAGSIWRAFFGSSRSDLAVRAELAAHHFLVVLLKPGLLMGAGLWLGFVVAVWRARWRDELRLPLLVFGGYIAVLMTLSWAQPHYMMPLFPILAIFASDGLVDLYRRRRGPALALAIAAAGSLMVDLYRCYPDYNLNGYQWTGERYLAGRASVGYRGIVQVRADGAEQALRWVNDHAATGDRVIHFLPIHIARRISGDSDFELIEGSGELGSIGDADFVVTQFNRDIEGGWGKLNPSGSIYQYPYDRMELESTFMKAFSVRRSFGIEVAAVWRRNAEAASSSSSEPVGGVTEPNP